MKFLPGTTASIQADTLENQCYSIARSIQNFERSDNYNPGEEINMITSSSNDDTQIFSGNCQIYTNFSLAPSGLARYEIPNPYIGLPEWKEGEGGQGTATTWVEALVERFLALAFYERDENYNTSDIEPKITDVKWELQDTFLERPVIYNCFLSFDFAFNYRIVESRNGTTTQALPYLQGDYIKIIYQCRYQILG